MAELMSYTENDIYRYRWADSGGGERKLWDWVEDVLTSVHRRSYKAPVIRRVHIPKPGKAEEDTHGIPMVSDRALQRSVSKVLSCIYEQDFLKCSFGGRENIEVHNALATFNEILTRKKVNWVLECDLKNFFGSLDHGWLLRFVEHRVGDPRILTLIRRWIKAGDSLFSGICSFLHP